MKPPLNNQDFLPLAARMRPRAMEEIVGQEHLLGPGKPLQKAITQGLLHSMILWGPPGTGKTTLAQLIADQTHAYFVELSAIFTGVKEIREEIAQAKLRKATGKRTILFIDEIHRFNKSQQDVFLPYMEDGTFVLVGATTENPSFELNSALLSRARVYVLKRLDEQALQKILHRALTDSLNGLGQKTIEFPENLQSILIQAADGDARQVLNLLGIIADLAEAQNQTLNINETILQEVLQTNLRRFDKKGEAFYDQISALHKSVRGSSPDASLYWFCRMLDGGCDPLYIARRVIRMAVEDIGLADPRALELALNAWDVYERLGSPEGELALAEAIVYLACVPKSNALYKAYNKALDDVSSHPSDEVPLHLRNAPTKLMKDLNYGKAYRYAHDEPEAYARGENYFPENHKGRLYYQPSERGLEAKIKERLAYLKSLDKGKS